MSPRRRSQPNGPRLQELHEDARRRYSRRGLFGVGAALATAGLVPKTSAFEVPTVLLSTQNNGAALRPFGRHIVFGADPTRQVVVSWQTPANVARPYLHPHNGVYERTDPIRAGKVTNNGTTYVTVGIGGQGLDKFSTDTKAWSRVRYRGYGLVAVDVAPRQMIVKALDEDGGTIDEFTLRRG